MVSYLHDTSYTMKSYSWFLNLAEKRGIARDKALNIHHILEETFTSNLVVESTKLIDLFLEEDNDEDTASISAENLFSSKNLFLWKLQGTDGIRGKVVKKETVSDYLSGQNAGYQTDAEINSPDAVTQLAVHGNLTKQFCYIYISAFITMLNENTAASMSTIVIAEDGRDYYERTELKTSIIKAAAESGVQVVDLGIVPTPYLAAYSSMYQVPGIMLTASHNPPEYNGVKLFLSGRKLYPFGDTGEYSLSWFVLRIASSVEKVSTHHEQRMSKTIDYRYRSDREHADGVHDEVLERMVFNVFKRSLLTIIPEAVINAVHIPTQHLKVSNTEAMKETAAIDKPLLLIDAANGAYSSLAERLCQTLGINCISAASSPGRGKINAASGVGEIENLPPSIKNVSQLTDLFTEKSVPGKNGEIPGETELGNTHEELPLTVKKLIQAGQKSVLSEIYALVLDGDGDRGFLLKYDRLNDELQVYDGNDIGYMAASALDDNSREGGAEKKVFAYTVESNSALKSVIEEKLHWEIKESSVGDRWLVEGVLPEDSLFTACERSGHVIIPVVLPSRGFSEDSGDSDGKEGDYKNDQKQVTLQTGNGFVTSVAVYLLMNSEMRRSHVPIRFRRAAWEKKDIFSPKQNSFYKFYRNSLVWKEIKQIVKVSFPWVCREKVFQEDPHMLYFDLLDTENLSLGKFHIRNSGTEPKISLTLSVQGISNELCRTYLSEVSDLIQTLLLRREKLPIEEVL